MSATATRSVSLRMKVWRPTWAVMCSSSRLAAGGDGPDDVAGAADRQPLPAAVEQQRGAGGGAGPAGAFVEPGLQVGAQLGVDRDKSRALPVPSVIRQTRAPVNQFLQQPPACLVRGRCSRSRSRDAVSRQTTSQRAPPGASTGSAHTGGVCRNCFSTVRQRPERGAARTSAGSSASRSRARLRPRLPISPARRRWYACQAAGAKSRSRAVKACLPSAGSSVLGARSSR